MNPPTKRPVDVIDLSSYDESLPSLQGHGVVSTKSQTTLDASQKPAAKRVRLESPARATTSPEKKKPTIIDLDDSDEETTKVDEAPPAPGAATDSDGFEELTSVPDVFKRQATKARDAIPTPEAGPSSRKPPVDLPPPKLPPSVGADGVVSSPKKPRPKPKPAVQKAKETQDEDSPAKSPSKSIGDYFTPSKAPVPSVLGASVPPPFPSPTPPTPSTSALKTTALPTPKPAAAKLSKAKAAPTPSPKGKAKALPAKSAPPAKPLPVKARAKPRPVLSAAQIAERDAAIVAATLKARGVSPPRYPREEKGKGRAVDDEPAVEAVPIVRTDSIASVSTAPRRRTPFDAPQLSQQLDSPASSPETPVPVGVAEAEAKKQEDPRVHQGPEMNTLTVMSAMIGLPSRIVWEAVTGKTAEADKVENDEKMVDELDGEIGRTSVAPATPAAVIEQVGSAAAHLEGSPPLNSMAIGIEPVVTSILDLRGEEEDDVDGSEKGASPRVGKPTGMDAQLSSAPKPEEAPETAVSSSASSPPDYMVGMDIDSAPMSNTSSVDGMSGNFISLVSDDEETQSGIVLTAPPAQPAALRSLAPQTSFISSTSVSDLSSIGSPIEAMLTPPSRPPSPLRHPLAQQLQVDEPKPPVPKKPTKPFNARRSRHFFPLTAPNSVQQTPAPKRKGEPTEQDLDRLSFRCGERLATACCAKMPLKEELARSRGIALPASVPRTVRSSAETPTEASLAPPMSAGGSLGTKRKTKWKRVANDKTIHGPRRPTDYDPFIHDAVANDRSLLTPLLYEAWLEERVQETEPDAPAILLKRVGKNKKLYNLGPKDETPPLLFTYTNRYIFSDRVLGRVPAKGCGCRGECDFGPNSTCLCGKRQQDAFRRSLDGEKRKIMRRGDEPRCLYTEGGLLDLDLDQEEDHIGKVPPHESLPIYECNGNCGCPPTCRNRVIGRGRKLTLHLALTKEMGWGVFNGGDKPIEPGMFVCNYSGEVVTDAESVARMELDDKLSSTYIYAMDLACLDPKKNDEVRKLMEDGVVILEASSAPAAVAAVRHREESPEVKETELDLKEGTKNKVVADYSVDARFFGNLSRFVNHRCAPNVHIRGFYSDDSEIKRPSLAYFAHRRIMPNEQLFVSYKGANEKMDMLVEPYKWQYEQVFADKRDAIPETRAKPTKKKQGRAHARAVNVDNAAVPGRKSRSKKPSGKKATAAIESHKGKTTAAPPTSSVASGSAAAPRPHPSPYNPREGRLQRQSAIAGSSRTAAMSNVEADMRRNRLEGKESFEGIKFEEDEETEDEGTRSVDEENGPDGAPVWSLKMAPAADRTCFCNAHNCDWRMFVAPSDDEEDEDKQDSPLSPVE